jgi:hypothetical protein
MYFLQKLVLHPHVFEQFIKLNLEPPSTYADVSGILEKLKEKKVCFKQLFPATNQDMIKMRFYQISSQSSVNWPFSRRHFWVAFQPKSAR